MSISKYNSEGYLDPTAYEALMIIEKEIQATEKAKKNNQPIEIYTVSCEEVMKNENSCR